MCSCLCLASLLPFLLISYAECSVGHTGGCGQRPNTLLLQSPQHIHTPMPFSLRRSTLPALPGRADLLLVLLLSSWGREGTMAARTSSRLSEGEDRLSEWPRLPSFQYSPGTSTLASPRDILQGRPVSMLLTEKKARQEEAHHTWHMKDGITLWKVDPLYPKPFSPVHRALKFSGWGWVGGEGKKQVSRARPQCRGHSWFQPAPSLPTHPRTWEDPCPGVSADGVIWAKWPCALTSASEHCGRSSTGPVGQGGQVSPASTKRLRGCTKVPSS